MIYIAGRPECTAAEMCRAEKAQEIILMMANTSVSIGFSLGGDRTVRNSFMEEAYSDIEIADAVVFLQDWKRHRATQIQHLYCKYTGKRVLYFKLKLSGAVLELPRRKMKRRVNNGRRKRNA